MQTRNHALCAEDLETMKDKIKQLLGLNLPNNVVASAVGVSESYISQLLSEESFAKEVSELRIVSLSESVERDQAYNKIEDALLEKVQEQLDNGMFGAANPRLILQALQVVNSAKRRSAPQELHSQMSRPVATLILPIAIAAKFVIDSKSQVVEVEGETMATMPASGVMKKLEELRGNEVKNVEEHEKDAIRARERIDAMKKLTHLPVAALL